MKLYCLVFFGMSVMITFKLKAQNVGVGTNAPHSSAILDVQSTNKGASLPSMTSAQRKAIVNPKTGLLVFDLDKNTLYLYDGAQWQSLLFSSETSLPPVKRVASDGQASDFFGSCVSISGDYAVVGAPGDDIGLDLSQGSAYVFFRSGSNWIQQEKLTASDGVDDDHFGSAVAISGNRIIVGAPGDDGLFANHGSAYIFVRSGSNWSQQDHIFASNAGANDRFGASVSISGDYAVVGSPYDDVNGNNDQGSVYFFARTGSIWIQEDNVIAPFGTTGDNFGIAVSVQGDYAIAGAPGDDIGGNRDQGSAHIFLRVGGDWFHQVTLFSATGVMFEKFGESVSIYGEWAVVGVPNYGTGIHGNAGAVYVYHRTGSDWSTGTRIDLPSLNVESHAEDFFGRSVSITADYLLVGADGVDISANVIQGSCYLFKRNNTTWRFLRKIVDASGERDDNMGNSVGISGFNCIAGASGFENFKGKVLFLNIE